MDTCPPDDRTPGRPIFQGATRQVLGNAMRNGCTNAGTASYSPHDLRHRYISVKLREGIPRDRDRRTRRPQPQVADARHLQPRHYRLAFPSRCQNQSYERRYSAPD